MPNTEHWCLSQRSRSCFTVWDFNEIYHKWERKHQSKVFHQHQSNLTCMFSKNKTVLHVMDVLCTAIHRYWYYYTFIIIIYQAIRHKLQKSKEGHKYESSKQRSSPVPANHQALSMTAPAALQLIGSKPLGIPTHIPKTNSMSRFQRNSVEGLNTVSYLTL